MRPDPPKLAPEDLKDVPEISIAYQHPHCTDSVVLKMKASPFNVKPYSLKANYAGFYERVYGDWREDFAKFAGAEEFSDLERKKRNEEIISVL